MDARTDRPAQKGMKIKMQEASRKFVGQTLLLSHIYSLNQKFLVQFCESNQH